MRNSPAYRRLSMAETTIARRIFSDGLDYTRIKIYRGIPYLPTLKAAVSPNGHIYFPRNNCPHDFTECPQHYQIWLIHELTHVWQYQHGYQTWYGGLLLGACGGYIGRSAYAYPPLAEIAHFGSLNMEQQADLLAHYYAARYLNHSAYKNDLPLFEKILQPFFNNPHDKSLLPKYRNHLKAFYPIGNKQPSR
ncbi:type IV secretion protein Rhs [Neisseria montereyensis]|uniref:Type IV secretion protein Rhs n=1 Tax=Neisseria montereyensis TaxID=2973938 RepID=A0ABT2FAI3_9NEIS|nr:type IV secretion protein Rhs [Neisseria montereyensis]MCS4532955.1 type IV secretion protein Rhs [Neisseria montereyensis]